MKAVVGSSYRYSTGSLASTQLQLRRQTAVHGMVQGEIWLISPESRIQNLESPAWSYLLSGVLQAVALFKEKQKKRQKWAAMSRQVVALFLSCQAQIASVFWQCF